MDHQHVDQVERKLISDSGPSKCDRTYLAALSSILCVILGYVWFISFGLWTQWPATTDYYDQLATAFAHGSVALEQKVDPAVLALANPYNPGKRGNVNIPIDFSLYHGKYYLYFGPVPALCIVIFKLLGAGVIGDQILVFFFVTGIGIIQALLLIKIRDLFFPSIPDWLLAICIVFAALICPFTWMLTEARVYEAAGTAAQYFFLVGCYLLLTTLATQSRPTAGFLAAGVAWMLSIGSRITQAVPIGLLTLLLGVALIWIYIRSDSWSNGQRRIVSLGLPFVIGFALLGWYNWARFGSVFETGFSYEITRTYLRLHKDELFSPLYILPNAFDYLVALPATIGQFPYLQPVRGRGELHFPFLNLPFIYYTRAMTGILVSVPFLAFAALSFPPLLPLKRRSSGATDHAPDAALLKWTIGGLWLAFLASLFVILSYFWVVTRFMADFSAPLVLLSVIGLWLGYRALQRRTVLRLAYLVAALALVLASIVISNLVVFSIHSSAFQINNPALWNLLFRRFPG